MLIRLFFAAQLPGDLCEEGREQMGGRVSPKEQNRGPCDPAIDREFRSLEEGPLTKDSRTAVTMLLRSFAPGVPGSPL